MSQKGSKRRKFAEQLEYHHEGDRVIILDCDQVREQNDHFIGCPGTILKAPFSIEATYKIKIDTDDIKNQDNSSSSILDLPSTAFLVSTPMGRSRRSISSSFLSTSNSNLLSSSPSKTSYETTQHKIKNDIENEKESTRVGSSVTTGSSTPKKKTKVGQSPIKKKLKVGGKKKSGGRWPDKKNINKKTTTTQQQQQKTSTTTTNNKRRRADISNEHTNDDRGEEAAEDNDDTKKETSLIKSDVLPIDLELIEQLLKEDKKVVSSVHLRSMYSPKKDPYPESKTTAVKTVKHEKKKTKKKKVKKKTASPKKRKLKERITTATTTSVSDSPTSKSDLPLQNLSGDDKDDTEAISQIAWSHYPMRKRKPIQLHPITTSQPRYQVEDDVDASEDATVNDVQFVHPRKRVKKEKATTTKRKSSASSTTTSSRGTNRKKYTGLETTYELIAGNSQLNESETRELTAQVARLDRRKREFIAAHRAAVVMERSDENYQPRHQILDFRIDRPILSKIESNDEKTISISDTDINDTTNTLSSSLPTSDSNDSIITNNSLSPIPKASVTVTLNRLDGGGGTRRRASGIQEEEIELWVLGNQIKICINERTQTWREGYIQQFRCEDDHHLIKFIDEESNSSSGNNSSHKSISDCEWINLRTRHVIEYGDFVWGKLRGWPWWPGQIMTEVKKGRPVEKPLDVTVKFAYTDEVNTFKRKDVVPFNKENTSKYTSKCQRKDLLTAVKQIEKKKKLQVQRRQDRHRAHIAAETSQRVSSILSSPTKVKSISKTTTTTTKEATTTTISKKNDTRNPLHWLGHNLLVKHNQNDEWSNAFVRKYDVSSRQVFLVYDNDEFTTEWINVDEIIVQFIESKNDELSSNINNNNNEITKKEHGDCWVCHGSIGAWGQGSELVRCIRCRHSCHSRCFNPLLNSCNADTMLVRCPECLMCDFCGKGDEIPNLILCNICEQRVHIQCLNPPLEYVPPNGWICDECVVCRSCNANNFSISSSSNITKNTINHIWLFEYTLCEPCGMNYINGKYCPLCDCNWSEETSAMICCDSCDRWVHTNCAGISDEDFITLCTDPEPTLFECQFCVMKNVSIKVKAILDKIVIEDKYRIFLVPVTDDVAPGYSNVIQVPMDVSTIRKKLDNVEYTHISEIRDDVNLMFRNAKAFNLPNSFVHRQADRLQRLALDLLDNGIDGSTKSSKNINGGKKNNNEKGGNSKNIITRIVKSTTSLSNNEKQIKQQNNNIKLLKLEEKNRLSALDRLISPIVKSWIEPFPFKTYDSSIIATDLCLICGSVGNANDFLFCIECGEGFHYFCVPGMAPVNYQRRTFWRCPNCMICSICGNATDPHKLLVCDTCDEGVHLNCLDPPLDKVPTGSFRCTKCVRCHSCGANTPGKGPNAHWMFNYSMCYSCGKKYQQKQYCPVCRLVWLDDDPTPMVACDSCNLWVHAKCLNMSKQRYIQLTTDPNAKFFCPECIKINPRYEQLMLQTVPTLTSKLHQLAIRIQQTRRRARRRRELDIARFRWLQHSNDEVTLPNNVTCIDSTGLHQLLFPSLKPLLSFPDPSTLPDPLQPALAPKDLQAEGDAIASYETKISGYVNILTKSRKSHSITTTTCSNTLSSLSPSSSSYQPAAMLSSEEVAVGILSTMSGSTNTSPNTITNCGSDITIGNGLKQKLLPPKEYSATNFQITTTNNTKTNNKRKGGNSHQQVDALQIPLSPALNGRFFSNDDPSHTCSDTRVCALCSVAGDLPENEAGRLLFADSYHFVHAQCILWSHEVYELVPGTLKSIQHALNRSRITTCLHCAKDGATITCHTKKCGTSYHWICAVEANVAFLTDGRCFCPIHTTSTIKSKILTSWDPLRLHRKIVVKADRKKSRQEDMNWISEQNATNNNNNNTNIDVIPSFPSSPTNSLMLRIGALTVRRLGTIIGDNPAFHSSSHIFPAGYMATRVFWSYKHPGQRCTYECVIDVSCSEPPVPVFSITASDDPTHLIKAQTSTDAWWALNSKRIGFRKRNGRRKRTRSGDTYAFGLSGPGFFGFGNPSVMTILEMHPDAEKCINYIFKYDAPQIAVREEIEGKKIDIQLDKLMNEKNLPINPSGCARTEGYKKREYYEKFPFLPPVVSTPSISTLEKETTSFSNDTRGTRKCVAQQGNSSTLPLLTQYRRLKSKENPPIVAKSKIHAWGLFAAESHSPHDLIIEYVGDSIRQKVADIREAKYETSGIGSCYMFRVDQDTIIDATKKGNQARFINHSCNSNCYSRIVNFDGDKKIFIFASSEISAGTELTYDYKFPIEGEKVVCKCGTKDCIGRMN